MGRAATVRPNRTGTFRAPPHDIPWPRHDPHEESEISRGWVREWGTPFLLVGWWLISWDIPEKLRQNWGYPLVNVYTLRLTMAIEFVDLPMKNGDFPYCKRLPEATPMTIIVSPALRLQRPQWWPLLWIDGNSCKLEAVEGHRFLLEVKHMEKGCVLK